MDWIEKFKNDVKEKVKASKVELNNYENTSRIIFLQQACEKLFSAVENFLMYKYRYRARSYQELYNKASISKIDSELLAQSVQLHYFFYNGTLQTDEQSIKLIFNSVMRKLENRI